MNKNTLDALIWIVKILNTNNIPHRLGGGTAAFLYGSGRKINDIDISISGEYFPVLIPLVKEYITVGPKHYVNEKWDCNTLSLTYNDQEIDLTDVNTLLMKSSFDDIWIKNKEIYEKYPDIKKYLSDGTLVTLMHPKVLLEYKQHLDGKHQKFDMDYLKKIIEADNY